jgi:hypothetical protein
MQKLFAQLQHFVLGIFVIMTNHNDHCTKRAVVPDYGAGKEYVIRVTILKKRLGIGAE